MNNTSKPLISVIIPTRERADTLLFAIRTALNQNNDDYEVIVCDNFSQDNTKEVVQSFNDPRLIYINPGRRLPMSDNWEFALEHARGEHVIFIGDDDGFMPGAIDKLKITIQNEPSLAYCWPIPVYAWPKNGQRASISYLPFNTRSSEINLKKLAKFVVNGGGTGYGLLPSVYHCAIPKSILDVIRKQKSRVFYSTQPDVFSSFALPVFLDTAINVGYFVTVAGQSLKANSTITYGKDILVYVRNFLQEYENYKIHSSLFPGIDVLVNFPADTILIAMEKFPQFYGGMRFNYNAMWAHTLRMTSRLKLGIGIKEIFEKRQQIRQYHSFSVIRFMYYYIFHKSVALYRQIQRKTIKLGPFSEHVPDNISDFVKQLSDYEKIRNKNK